MYDSLLDHDLEDETTVAADVATTPAPSDDELRLIREELDPGGAYTK